MPRTEALMRTLLGMNGWIYRDPTEKCKRMSQLENKNKSIIKQHSWTLQFQKSE